MNHTFIFYILIIVAIIIASIIVIRLFIAFASSDVKTFILDISKDRCNIRFEKFESKDKLKSKDGDNEVNIPENITS